MQISVRNRRDVIGGALLVALAVFLIAYGWGLRIGTASRMGPGYVPQLLNAGLLLLGAMIAARGFVLGGPPPAWPHWRPFATIVAMPVLFALLIVPAGLVATVAAATFLVSKAVVPGRWTEGAVFAVLLALACAAIFVGLLSLPIPLLPAPLRPA